MSIQALACPKCGGGITVPPDLEFFNCAYCGTGIQVKRGEGYVALKLAEVITNAIHESSANTQSAIRQGNQQTQAEMQRLHLGQQLSAAQLQLTSVQGEIRTLERMKQNGQTRRQLKQLRTAEQSLIQQINSINAALYPNQAAATRATAPARASSGRWKTGCVLGFATYLLLTVFIVMVGMSINREAFASGSPLATTLSLFAFIVGVIVFVYYMNPNSQLFMPIKRMILPSAKSAAPAAESRPVETVSEIANPFNSSE